MLGSWIASGCAHFPSITLSSIPIDPPCVISGHISSGQICTFYSGHIGLSHMSISARRIDRRMLLFQAELQPEPERCMIISLYDNPSDKMTRDAYADYLEERGRYETSKAVRNGWTPGEY